MSISVVIPVYNSSRYIAETLNSVLAQTLAADEILVIDDGSTDETASIAENFGAPVRVIRRENSGQSASRNFGVLQAASEWIAFIDSDDLWEPNKLEMQMRELARNPEADVCYSGLVQFHCEESKMHFGACLLAPAADDLRASLFRNTTFLPSSVLIRRQCFLSVGGFNESMKFVEDWDLWLRIMHAGKQFTGCREPLLRYRVHAGSMSHSALPSLEAQKEVYRRLVLPHLPRATRWLEQLKSQSGQEAYTSLVQRRLGDPAHIGTMTSSILRYPWNRPHRYKIFAHMIYTRAAQEITYQVQNVFGPVFAALRSRYTGGEGQAVGIE